MTGYLNTEGAVKTVFAPTDAALREMRENSIGAQIIHSNTEFRNVRIDNRIP